MENQSGVCAQARAGAEFHRRLVPSPSLESTVAVVGVFNSGT